jgi:hypothetical protein
MQPILRIRPQISVKYSAASGISRRMARPQELLGFASHSVQRAMPIPRRGFVWPFVRNWWALLAITILRIRIEYVCRNAQPIGFLISVTVPA